MSNHTLFLKVTIDRFVCIMYGYVTCAVFIKLELMCLLEITENNLWIRGIASWTQELVISVIWKKCS
jgi:hypothetical protein